MISSFDFLKSGAKVIRFPGMCKQKGGAGQNLICNVLIISRMFSRRANQTVSC